MLNSLTFWFYYQQLTSCFAGTGTVWKCVKATWTGIVPDCLTNETSPRGEGMNLHHWLNQPSFGRWETMMSSANSNWGNKHTTSPKTSVSLQSSTWPVATLVQPPKIVSSGLSVTSCASLAPDDLEQLPTLTSTKLPACDNVPRPLPAEVNVNLWPGRNLCKPESSASFDSLFLCSTLAKTSMMSLFFAKLRTRRLQSGRWKPECFPARGEVVPSAVCQVKGWIRLWIV